MTRKECIDNIQKIIDENMDEARVRVHIGYLRMSERQKKRLVEFIESYWTGGEHGSDYIWNDNHGELVRCKDCGNRECDGREGTVVCGITGESHSRLWFCADGERKEIT